MPCSASCDADGRPAGGSCAGGGALPGARQRRCAWRMGCVRPVLARASVIRSPVVVRRCGAWRLTPRPLALVVG